MNASTLKQKLKRNKIARIGAKVLLPNPYPKYYEKLDVDRNIILYESFYGKGMLVEGDIGKLSFQGTRYLGFQRN